MEQATNNTKITGKQHQAPNTEHEQRVNTNNKGLENAASHHRAPTKERGAGIDAETNGLRQAEQLKNVEQELTQKLMDYDKPNN